MKKKKQEQRMSPKNENGSSAQDARRTMREMLRIYVSFPRHILSVHVKKLSEQLDRALRTDVYGFHERNHKSHQELP